MEREVDDRGDDPQTRWLHVLGLRSRVDLPLRGRERVLGMLVLAWEAPGGLAHDLFPILNQIVEAIALALEKQDLFAAVRAGRQRLEAVSQRLLEVQEFERRHLACELHDEIGQALTALRLQLDVALREPSAGPAVTVLRSAHEQVGDLLGRVRNLALALRPAMLDDLGLLPTLVWLFDRYEHDTRIRVRFEHREIDRRFRPELETAAYRIVQEALTNVARHADVPAVTVRAWSDTSTLGVQIVDAGVGFDESRREGRDVRTGLAGMRERAALLGGTLAVESKPGQGTRIAAELPLVAPAAAAHEEAPWSSV